MIKNLVSLSSLLATCNFKAMFDDTGCILEQVSGNRQVVRANLVESLYCINARHVAASVHISVAAQQGPVDATMLWHARLAHVHESKMVSLHKTDLYRHQMSVLTHLLFCDACARGKSKESPYSKKSAYRATEKLELVHTDLCGLVCSQSFGGAAYFIPFVDDCTRMCFVYFLHHKHQALETFLLFLEMAEQQSGHRFVCFAPMGEESSCHMHLKSNAHSVVLLGKLLHLTHPQ